MLEAPIRLQAGEKVEAGGGAVGPRRGTTLRPFRRVCPDGRVQGALALSAEAGLETARGTPAMHGNRRQQPQVRVERSGSFAVTLFHGLTQMQQMGQVSHTSGPDIAGGV